MASFYGTTLLDVFIGPDEVNDYNFGTGELQFGDFVTGSDVLSADTLNFSSAQSLGVFNFLGVSHVEFLYFDGTDDEVAIPDWLAATAEPHFDAVGAITYTLFVRGGGGADTLDASAVISDLPLLLEGQDGNDTIISGGGDGTKLTGGDGEDGFVLASGAEEVLAGDEDDRIYADAADVDGDTIDGGEGDDDLETFTAGTIAFSMIGIETIVLAVAGANDVTIDSDAHDGGEDVAPRVVGGGFADTVTIMPGSSGLIGSTYENYTILGQGGVNILTAGEGDDTLDGGSEADSLGGGGGNDTLIGGSGGDIMTGGSGDDLYVGVEAGDFVNELFSTGTDTIQTALTVYTMHVNTEILDYTGTAAVSFTGNTKGNTIEGSASNDDFIWGGEGNDSLKGFGGADTLRGEAGIDRLIGGAGNDILEGGSENDTLVGGSNDDVLKGGSGDDTLRGDDGADTLDGNGGTDTAIYVTATAAIDVDLERTLDQAITAAGIDQLSGIENVTGTAVGDVLRGDSFANVLTGSGGTDTLNGRDGADTLDGGTENDLLLPGRGDDTVIGGSGVDTVDYSFATANLGAIYLEALGGTVVTGADTGTDDLSSIEIIIGGAGNDAFSGWPEAHGGAGNDTFDANTAVNSFHGDEGIDTVRYFDAPGVSDLVVDLENPASNQHTAAGDTLVSIENLTYIGASIANLLGDGADNRLQSGGTLNSLSGRGGNDTLVPLAALDIIDGGEGFDTADYSLSTAAVTLTQVGIVIQGDGGVAYGDGMVNVEALKGSAFGDTMTVGDTGFTLSGQDGADTLTAGWGADTLDGGVGVDQMTGGGGSDTYVVDNLADGTVEAANAGTDLIQSSITLSLTARANIENLTLTGVANIYGTGNTLANTITGNTANSFIDGKEGNDVLAGNGGSDQFLFTTALNALTNLDQITDFNVADDYLRIDNAVFAALPVGYLAVASFHTGASAADTLDRIIYDAANGNIYYDPDGVGGAAQTQFATLSAGLALGNADIFVF